MSHPPVEILVQHAFGLGTAEAEHIVFCAECSQEVEELAALKSGRKSLDLPEELADLTSRFEEERSSAHELLRGLSPDQVRESLLAERELETAGGFQALIEAIPSIRRSDPARALTIAQELIVNLETGIVPAEPALRDELHADALREAAACARVLGRYDQAVELLGAAEDLAQGIPTGDHLLARIWYERAGIEVSREGPSTREWAMKAAEAFARFGDNRRHNRSRYLAAASWYNDRDYREVIVGTTALLPLLRDDEDMETVACALAMLGQALTKENFPSSAAEAFTEAISLFRTLGLPIDAHRARWGHARTRMKLGHVDDAVRELTELRSLFENLDLAEEASLVGLDLTEGLLLLDSAEDARAICLESVSVLGERFAGREQQRALAYLRELSMGELKAEEIHVVSSYLFDSLTDADSPFHPPPF